MPEITFILPHGIYWGMIFIIPLLFFGAMRLMTPSISQAPSLLLSYFFMIVGGIMGIHRLYIKSFWAITFITLFIGIIYCNNEARLTRNEHSIARNDVVIANYDKERAVQDEAQPAVIEELNQTILSAGQIEKILAKRLAWWHQASQTLAIIIALLLVLDIFLMPRAVRQYAKTITNEKKSLLPSTEQSTEPIECGSDWFSKMVAKINGFVGEFICYWTVIAVFVFYYEVLARYIFNSPTIWAHESMYLLFGMQYLLAGGFCLRQGAHVRVDVFYMNLSARNKAIWDVCSSVFFFIFTVSLAITGWIFFNDSFSIREVSFSEWAIPHFPIKFALPLGGVLIILQGIAKLLHDIEVLRRYGSGN